jgi:hypothetical protein
MKSRLSNTVCLTGRRLPLRFAFSHFAFSNSLPRLSQTGITLGGAVCALALSGCYYPYGYYPGGYYPYYATVPAAGTQQAVPVGQDDSAAAQQQQAQPAQPGQQPSPPSYAVAAPPVYVAPAYPAYYPPAYPAYPAYYGYPGWYGPSVSIGFGFGGYWGGHGGWGGHGHWH